MAVVAAGMHDVGVGGGVGHAAGFQDRQRVHIGAQADGAVGLASADGSDDAVAADAGGEGDAEFGQTISHEGGGLMLVESEFGIRVQVSSPPRQPVMQGFVHPGSGASRA